MTANEYASKRVAGGAVSFSKGIRDVPKYQGNPQV